MAQIKYIKDLYENEEASLREIFRITGHSFETVRKYAYQENWSEDNLPDIEPQSYPVLQDFIPIIDKWLEEDRKAPRKQRHTVMRIYHRLCDEHGFTGCYSTVKKYVRKKKYVMKTLSAGYLPLDHPKGWGQVDFGLAEGEWAATGERFPFYALTISFPGSNNGVTQAFPSQNQECLLEGMKRIFEHIGGVPPRLRFDNMTTAVAQVLKDGERVLTDGFMLDTSHISPDGAFVTGRHQAQPDMAVAERLGKLPLTAIQKLVQGERGHLHGLAPGFQVGQFQHIQHQLIQPVNFLNHGSLLSQ